MSEEKFVYNACPGWGDHEYCVIKTVVKDGKIDHTEAMDYTGSEAQEGYICQKGLIGCRAPYLENRLLHPLKRVGARGEGKWEQISWDQALDEIAAKLIELRDKYGPESVAMWWMSSSTPPTMGLNCLLNNRFMAAWGATDPQHGWGVDNGAIYAPYFELGHSYAWMNMDPRLIPEAKYIIVWGANPVENQARVTRYLVEAQERGTKVVDIGLVFDGTAAKADQFIPVKPGSDAALALTLANIIVSEGLFDAPFLLKHTVAPFLVRSDTGKFLHDAEQNYVVWDGSTGKPINVPPRVKEVPEGTCLTGVYNVEGIECRPAFQLLIEHLQTYTPEWQETVTGVAPETVRQLAHEYATIKPAMLVGILGMRYQNNGAAHRAHLLLGTLTGNLGPDGGGVTISLTPSGYPLPFNDAPIVFPKGMPTNTKIKRMVDFFDQVQTGDPYPIKAFLKLGGNPLHNAPNRGRWVDEIFPKMELIVEYDIYMTDTGEQADYVLPDCTTFERMELIAPSNYNHIILAEPAIEPQGEARDASFVFRELAKRVGLGEYFGDKTAEDWIAIRLQSDHPQIAGVHPTVTIERLKQEKRIRANVPDKPMNCFEGLNFYTKSGRVEFYVEDLFELGEALARYRPPLEVGNPEKAKDHPYQFFSGRQRFFMQSLFSNDPLMAKMSGGQPSARMNPVDAKKANLKSGDWIECFNDRGTVKVPLRLDEAIPPGTVQVWFGWRHAQFKEGTYANLCTPMSSHYSTDELADFWWDHVVKAGRAGSFFGGGESSMAGAWDTLWDCVCDVRKVEEV